MPGQNAFVAATFDAIADVLDIEEANPFRIRAYRTAAQTIRNLGDDVAGMVRRGVDLRTLPGIGADLAGKIREVVETGHSTLLDSLRGKVPAGVAELLKIPGLGPHRVRALYHGLDVETPAQLERAAAEGRVRQLPGFGRKVESLILEQVRRLQSRPARFRLAQALPRADALLAHLRSHRDTREAALAGSARRMKETVGDLDLVVASRSPDRTIDHFVRHADVELVSSRGATRASVVLRGGLQVDLRAVEPGSFGAALHYFTGSRSHVLALRRRAQSMGLKVNEYGVHRGKARLAGATEASVYDCLGLPWIEPELREDDGEVEAALEGRLPDLLTMDDLKGDLHVHSRASDGGADIEAMALAARARGLRYIAITDHSRSLAVAHGLDAARLGRQIVEIDALNRRLKGITVLTGVEVDILEDGRLDLPDTILARLDVVVAAVHSRFDLPEWHQTTRVLKALEHPAVSILAHPTGRLLGEREPFEIDMRQVFQKARARGCHVELNSHPARLDIDARYCRMARDMGVMVSINSDAHAPGGFDDLRFGLGQARRGWLEKSQVLNACTLPALRKRLARHTR